MCILKAPWSLVPPGRGNIAKDGHVTRCRTRGAKPPLSDRLNTAVTCTTFWNVDTTESCRSSNPGSYFFVFMGLRPRRQTPPSSKVNWEQETRCNQRQQNKWKKMSTAKQKRKRSDKRIDFLIVIESPCWRVNGSYPLVFHFVYGRLDQKSQLVSICVSIQHPFFFLLFSFISS